MRAYLSKKLIIATLTAYSGQALTKQELHSITAIPMKTLKSQLKHLCHENQVQRRAVATQKQYKHNHNKYNQLQVWYFINKPGANPPGPEILNDMRQMPPETHQQQFTALHV